nr:uncharacterized protein LOC105349133 [Crassostrea gigas]
MGIFQSCLRKNNKVSVAPCMDEEDAAYEQIQKVNMEQAYEETRMKTIADMFCVTSVKDCREDDGGHHGVINSSEEKADPQNSFKSSVPKLPRIDEHIWRIRILDDDAVYQKWKERVHNNLKEKGLWKEDKLSPLRQRQRERRLAMEAK